MMNSAYHSLFELLQGLRNTQHLTLSYSTITKISSKNYLTFYVLVVSIGGILKVCGSDFPTKYLYSLPLNTFSFPPAPAVKFSNDTERLQHINSIRKAPGAQIKRVIDLLLETRQAPRPEKTNEACYVDVNSNKAVFDSLKNNLKVSYNGQRFFYKSKHDVKDKTQLTTLIRKFPEGIAVIDLKDAYTTVMEDFQEDIAYPNDPRMIKFKVDDDLKLLFRGIELPRHMLDNEKDLQKNGMKPATNTAKRTAAAQAVALFKSYFGGAFDEDAVRNNFVLIYGLLDEIMDFGRPQNLSPEILKHYITQEGGRSPFSSKPSDKPGPNATLQVTGAVGWRREGLVFLDIVESVNLLMSSKDNTGLRSNLITTSDVMLLGRFLWKCFLSGMPDLKLGLSDKSWPGERVTTEILPCQEWQNNKARRCYFPFNALIWIGSTRRRLLVLSHQMVNLN
ncbi:hypothetical protein Tsubulata_012121 [Turnera subulata]|uniref:Transcription initiation factor IIE subunit beta n=1 Tax=Turnera subulata TaxID=218843 RepID=A0A9Q0FGG2_9ROSI|nr:hypothetical protein Tsubulata_012121 [Turnera subulata]